MKSAAVPSDTKATKHKTWWSEIESLGKSGVIEYDLEECIPDLLFLQHLSQRKILSHLLAPSNDPPAKPTYEARFRVIFLANQFLEEVHPTWAPNKEALLKFYNDELMNTPCPELKKFISQRHLLDMPDAANVMFGGYASNGDSYDFQIIGAANVSSYSRSFNIGSCCSYRW